MGLDQDRALFVEIVVEQARVKLLAVEDVEAQGRLVQHQQAGIDGHDQCQVELGDHTLGQLFDLVVERDFRLGKILEAALSRESGMNTLGNVEQLPDANPARQHRHVGDKTHVFHQRGALTGGVFTEYA